MNRNHKLQSLERLITQASQECATTLTDAMEMEQIQDVAGDLEVFIQLAKTGHYDRAMPFFDQYLRQHSQLFPVAAEYADALLEQGAFARADKFLIGVLGLKSTTSMSKTERDVLELLSAIAKMHTSLELESACKLASTVLEDMSPQEPTRLTDGELQVMALCLRIDQEYRRTPFAAATQDSHLGRIIQKYFRKRSRTHATISRLSASGHVCLAQVLLSGKLVSEGKRTRETAEVSWHETSLAISSMSNSSLPPALLVNMGVIGDYCQWLVSNPDELRDISTSTLPQEIESKLRSLLPSSMSTGSLHAIDTRLEDTRQLKYARYTVGCVTKATTYAQDIVGKDRQDHAMTLLAQSNLARFRLFQAMDLESTYSLLSANDDRLGWLSLLAILQPMSMSARKAVEARHGFTWKDHRTVSKIRDELSNKVGASQKDVHSSASRKGTIGSRLGMALGAAVAVPAVVSVAAAGAIAGLPLMAGAAAVGAISGLPLAAGVAGMSGLLNSMGIGHESTDLSRGITALAIVFTEAVQECDRVQLKPNLGAKSRALNIRFASAQLRLSRWGVSIGLDRKYMSDSGALDSSNVQEILPEESVRAAGAALEQTLSTLESAQKTSNLYSAAIGDNTITTQSATPVYQCMRSMSLSRLNHNLLNKREKWWLSDLETFERLIWYIVSLGYNLEKLFPESEDARQRLAVQEAKSLTGSKVRSSLREALQEQDGFEDDVLRRAITTVQPTIQFK